MIKNSNSRLSNKFLILNIVVISLIVIFTSTIIENMLNDNDVTVNLIYESDKIYVKLSQNFDINNPENTKYINELKEKYDDFEIIICNEEGDIKLKSDNVSQDKIDIEKIHDIMVSKSGDYNPFIQKYYLKSNMENYELITMKYRKESNINVNYLMKIVLPIIIILGIEYFVIRRKLNVLTYICNGIVKISKEDLSYRLENKSNDEFGVLSNEINKMAINLQNKIEAEAKNYKLKNELITNISHDLRTPLTSLIGYINLTKNDNINEEDKRTYLEKALEKAERIKILISELFEYSKLESGEVKLEKYPINIIEMMEQCIGENTSAAEENNLQIIKKYTDFKCLINVDGNIMSRVFGNILENAIKYSTENSKIYVDVVNYEDKLKITFENTAKEIVNNMDDRLFKRFYRGDESRNQKISGSGLGLFIAKSIIDMHGGKIYIETEGYQFKVSIELIK